MFKMIISLLMIFLSLFMFFVTHPLAMGLLILTQTTFLTIYMGMFTSTYWFSYILFLVFLGGLLVLFIYVSNIASNEILNFSFKFKIKILFMLILLSMILIFMQKNYLNFNFFYNNEMTNLLNNFLFFDENKINLSKLYDKQTYFLIMILIIYLFITLIAVIKISDIFFGPLRSFN